MRKALFQSILLLCVFIVSAFAQDPHENGILMVESIFDDFDPGPLNAGGLTVVGIFDDVEGNDTGVMEIEVPGGTENSWNELLQVNWDTPENSDEIVWRFQYRIRVSEVPYQAQVRLQINQEPWNGFNEERVIPAGHEEKWIFFDFLEGPFSNFNFEVLNFSLRFGAQQLQFMWLDDIRVYQSNALQISSFESSRVDGRFATPFNAEVEFVQEDNAPEGFQFIRAAVTDPGSSLSGAWLNPSRVVNTSMYDGALRLVVEARVSEAPFELGAGFANSRDLDDQLVVAQDTVTIQEAGIWTTAFFLIQPLPFFEERMFFPFIQFGGQGNAEIDLDRLTILKTDEVVDVPVTVQEWSIY